MIKYVEIMPGLVAMGLLLCCSAFFSASEAALFYLKPGERRALRRGTPADRMVDRLLSDPDRVLSAILFWNLIINIGYFTLSSIYAIKLGQGIQGSWQTVTFAAGSLVAIIFFGEMLPKSFGVLAARQLSRSVAYPLAVSVRVVNPIIPLLQTVSLISRRLILPRFQREPYLSINDLERAIQLSVTDARLLRQEQAVLKNIVLLSDIRVDEWMRPRTQFLAFRPPVHLVDLQGRELPGGFLLVTEAKSEEIARAVRLRDYTDLPTHNIDRLALPVVYLPWCTTVGLALEQLKRLERDVAVIVNEFGETIGILTMEDIFETIFNYAPSRSKRILDESPIHYIRPNCWVVSGMVSLRQLSRRLNVALPPTYSITISGVIQDRLQRIAKAGDECDWGPFALKVLEYPFRGHMLVEVSLRHPSGEGS